MGVLYPCHPRGARGRETREREPSVSGGTRRVVLPRTASHSSLLVQSDASQEAERTNERTACLACLPACFTARLAARPADAPNLSYDQFVLFYSFIALANWRTLPTRLFRAWPLYSYARAYTKDGTERRSGDVCVCVCVDSVRASHQALAK